MQKFKDFLSRKNIGLAERTSNFCDPIGNLTNNLVYLL